MSQPEEPSAPVRPRRNIFHSILRWIGITAAAIVAIIIIAVTIAVSYLQPERLTPLANRHADEYLLADVEASRVELTFWSSFPRLDLVIDSLTIDSRALDGLSPEQLAGLPADACRLLTADRLRGSINLAALAAGQIRLHGVELANPRINIVAVAPDTANYLIAIPSDTPEPATEEPLSLPDIVIDRFAITGSAPIRYFSAADSVDLTVTLSRTSLDGRPAEPAYRIVIAGHGHGTLGRVLDIDSIPMGLDGQIRWNAATPLDLEVRDFTVMADSLAIRLDASLDLGDELAVKALRVSAERFDLARALRLLRMSPSLAPLHAELSRVATDLTLDLDAKLSEPFRPGLDSIPSAQVSLALKGRASYGQSRPFDIKARANALIDGRDISRSRVEIEELRMTGQATAFTLKSSVADPMGSPRAIGRFEGGIHFGALPARLYDRLGITVDGLLTADTSFDLSLADLTPERFHRVRIDGSAHLRQFKALTADSTVDITADGATLRFGTSSTLHLPGATADSLLTLSVILDTVSAKLDRGDIHFAATELRAGIGARNVASSLDTSQVNPIGATLSAEKILFRSRPDSMAARLADISARTSLTRFNGNARAPQLRLKLDARRMNFVNPDNRAALREASFDLAMHLRGRDSLAMARRTARLDSLRAAYPGLTDDSIRSVLRRRFRARRLADSTAYATGEMMDFGIDRSLARRLRRLDARGSVTVNGGRLLSRHFPLRSRLRGLGLHFTTDSIVIDSARLTTGRSDISVTGSVANIARALSSPTGILDLDFSIYADTIDVNQITGAIFAGAEYAAGRHRSDPSDISDASGLSDMTDDDLPADSAAPRAIIIPSNIDARLDLRADHVFYSDLRLRNFRGSLALHDGALALDRLAGSTDFGSLNVTALYEAPSPERLRFSAGVIIDRLKVNRFLDLMPHVDSVIPLLRNLDGVIDAEMALTTRLDSALNLRLPTLNALLSLAGDSLRLLDSETFATIGKWLMFKDRRNVVIDHMDVELMVRDSRLDIFPFMFDIDRYRLGVSGTNDLALNLDYHIAVLKSPLPFRFGINIKGTPEDMKIRLGGAHFDRERAYSHRRLTDTARVNLLTEIERVFRRGVSGQSDSAILAIPYLDITAPISAMPLIADTLFIPASAPNLWD